MAGDRSADFSLPLAGLASQPAPSCQQRAVLPDAARQTVSQTVGLIGDRVSSVISGGTVVVARQALGAADLEPVGSACGSTTTIPTEEPPADGLAGAADARPAKRPTLLNNVWTAGSYTGIKKSDLGGEFKGTVKTGLAGYDRRLTQNLVLGMAFGYETVDVKTIADNGTVKSDSVSLSPYLGYAITRWLTADITVGHSWVNYDFTRSAGTITAKSDASRWFGATNLTATQRYKALTFRGGIGYLRLNEHQNGYTDSSGLAEDGTSLRFGQARATVGVGYDLWTKYVKLTPNLFARYEYDLPKATAVSLGNGLVSNTDRSGMVFGAGLDAEMGNGLKLNLAATTSQFRDNTDITSVSGGLRFNF